MAVGARAIYREAAGGESLTTSAVTVPFDTTVEQDADFTISGAGVVTINASGTHKYLVSYASAFDAAASHCRVGMVPRINGAGIPEGRASTNVYTDGDGRGACWGGAVLELAQNDTLDLQALVTDLTGQSPTRAAGDAGLQIVRIPDALPAMRAVRTSAGDKSTGSWAGLPFSGTGTTVRENDLGTLPVDGSYVPLEVGKRYLVFVNVNGLSDSASDPCTMAVRLAVGNSSGTYIAYPGAEVTQELRGANFRRIGDCSWGGILEIETPGFNRLQVQYRTASTGGANWTPQANAAALQVVELPVYCDVGTVREVDGTAPQRADATTTTALTLDTVDETSPSFERTGQDDLQTQKGDAYLVFLHAIAERSSSSTDQVTTQLEIQQNGTALAYGGHAQATGKGTSGGYAALRHAACLGAVVVANAGDTIEWRHKNVAGTTDATCLFGPNRLTAGALNLRTLASYDVEHTGLPARASWPQATAVAYYAPRIGPVSYMPPEAVLTAPQQKATVFWRTDLGAWPGPGKRPVLMLVGGGAFLRVDPVPGITNANGVAGIAAVNTVAFEWIRRGGILVSFGTVGLNPSAPLTPDPTSIVRHDGTGAVWDGEDFDDPDVWFADKDIVWARKWLGQQMADGAIPGDPTRIGGLGQSSPGVIQCTMGLGPERVWPSLVSSQGGQPTTLRWIAFVSPSTWFPAYKGTFPGLHWEKATGGGEVATLLSEVAERTLIDTSPIGTAREANNRTNATAVFLFADEPVGSTDFSLDENGYPALRDAFDFTTLHAAWFSEMFWRALLADAPDFHERTSRYYLRDTVTYTGQSNTHTFAGTVSQSEALTAQLESMWGAATALWPGPMRIVARMAQGVRMVQDPGMVSPVRAVAQMAQGCAWSAGPSITIEHSGVVASADVALAGSMNLAVDGPPDVSGYSLDPIVGSSGQSFTSTIINSGGLIASAVALSNPWDAIQAPILTEPDIGDPLPGGAPPFVEGGLYFDPADHPTFNPGNAIVEVLHDRWVHRLTGRQSRKDPYGYTLEFYELIIRGPGPVGGVWTLSLQGPSGSATISYTTQTGDNLVDVAAGLSSQINSAGIGLTSTRSENLLTIQGAPLSAAPNAVQWVARPSGSSSWLQFSDPMRWIQAGAYEVNKAWVAAGQTGPQLGLVVNGDMVRFNPPVTAWGGGSRSGESGERVAWTTTGNPRVVNDLPTDGSTPIEIDMFLRGRNGRDVDKITTQYLHEKVGGVVYGFRNLQFWDLTIENGASFDRNPLGDDNNNPNDSPLTDSDGTFQRAIGSAGIEQTGGRLVLKRYRLAGNRYIPNSDGGFGSKWGMRIQMALRYHCEDGVCEDQEEHFNYVDNINTDRTGRYSTAEDTRSYFVRLSNVGRMTPDSFGKYGGGCGRTFFQQVCRPTEQSDMLLPVFMSCGLVLLEDIHAWDCAVEGNESTITFATPLHKAPGRNEPWQGTILVRNYTRQEGPRNRLAPPGTGSNAARIFLTWQDRVTHHGIRYTPEGFIGERVVLQGIKTLNLEGDKPIMFGALDTLIQPNGIRDVQLWIDDWRVGTDSTRDILDLGAMENASIYGGVDYGTVMQFSNNPPEFWDPQDGFDPRPAGVLCSYIGSVRIFSSVPPSQSCAWNWWDGTRVITGSAVFNKCRIADVTGWDPTNGALTNRFHQLFNHELDEFWAGSGIGLPAGFSTVASGPGAGNITGVVTSTFPDFDLENDDPNKTFRLRELARIIADGQGYVDIDALPVPTTDVAGVRVSNFLGTDYAQIRFDLDGDGSIVLAHTGLRALAKLPVGSITQPPPVTITHTGLRARARFPLGSVTIKGARFNFVGGLNGSTLAHTADFIFPSNVLKQGYAWQFWNRQTNSLVNPLGNASKSTGFAPTIQGTGYPDLASAEFDADASSSSGYYAASVLHQWQRGLHPPREGYDTEDTYTIRWNGAADDLAGGTPKICDLVGASVGALVERGPFHVKRRISPQVGNFLALLVKVPGVLNIRVYPPDHDEVDGVPPPTIYPLWLQRTREVVLPGGWWRAIQYLSAWDCGSTTDSNLTWDGRGASWPYTTKGHALWARGEDHERGRRAERRPIPDEVLAELWEALDCNLWYNFPHVFLYEKDWSDRDAYAEAFFAAVQGVYLRLNPQRLMALVLSNELWNAKEPQFDYLRYEAQFGVPWKTRIGQDYDRLWTIALRHIPRNRLALVVEAHISDSPPFLIEVLDNTGSHRVDAVAISSYVACQQSDIAFWRQRYLNSGNTIVPTEDEILTSIETRMVGLPGALQAMQTKLANWTAANPVKQAGIPPQLVVYEYGFGDFPDSFWAANFRLATNFNERAYRILETVHGYFDAAGVTVACYYDDFGDDLVAGSGGGFGARRNLWDDEATMPRWRALRRAPAPSIGTISAAARMAPGATWTVEDDIQHSGVRALARIARGATFNNPPGIILFPSTVRARARVVPSTFDQGLEIEHVGVRAIARFEAEVQAHTILHTGIRALARLPAGAIQPVSEIDHVGVRALARFDRGVVGRPITIEHVGIRARGAVHATIDFSPPINLSHKGLRAVARVPYSQMSGSEGTPNSLRIIRRIEITIRILSTAKP